MQSILRTNWFKNKKEKHTLTDNNRIFARARKTIVFPSLNYFFCKPQNIQFILMKMSHSLCYFMGKILN